MNEKLDTRLLGEILALYRSPAWKQIEKDIRRNMENATQQNMLMSGSQNFSDVCYERGKYEAFLYLIDVLPKQYEAEMAEKGEDDVRKNSDMA